MVIFCSMHAISFVNCNKNIKIYKDILFCIEFSPRITSILKSSLHYGKLLLLGTIPRRCVHENSKDVWRNIFPV